MALTKITGQVINDTTGLVVGVTTVGGGISATDGFFSGIVTFSNDVSIAGTLTYEDVTNIDAVGLVTARNGIVVGSGITLSKDGDGFFTGVVTATSYYGDGSNLSNVTSTTINTNADNRLITGSGTANTLNGEENLTFDGSKLGVNVSSPSYTLDVVGDSGGAFTASTNSTAGQLSVVGKNSAGNVSAISRIKSNPSGSGNTSDMSFETRNSSSQMVERVRIDSNGKILAGATSSRTVAGGDAKLQVEATSSEGVSITRTSADAGAVYLSFGKTRNGSACQAGDIIGSISWNPDDGTDLNHAASEIQTVVASGIGGDDVPGDLVFKTNGGATTTTERLRITSNGGLEQNGGVAAHYVLTNSGKAVNHIHVDGPTGNSGEMGGAISFDCGGTGSAAIAGLQQSADPDKIGLAFIVHKTATASDNAIEAARFDNDGKFLVGRTGSITIASDPGDSCFEQLTNNGMPLTLHCAQTDKRGLGIYYTSGGSPSDFIRCQIDSSAKFLVTGNGNAQNANNSYGSISDASLKENIVDANSQWDDIKNIRVRNYNFKESTGQPTHTQIGVVAQELETVSPKLVEVSDKDGMKNVQYSVLYMKSVKALQEAMARIETLEAKVAALEGS